MKNIHVIPTDKSSKLWFYKEFENLLTGLTVEKSRDIHPQNIYITNDEVKKHNEWVLSNLNEVVRFCRLYCQNSYKKIILTTDQDLIKDGVQAIDDEFLEWFVKNPSCEKVEIEKEQYHTFVGMKKYPMIPNYKIIIPAEELEQEITLEEETIENKFKSLVTKWQQQQINYETLAEHYIDDQHNNRKFTYKAITTRDCWKELLTLLNSHKDEK